MKYIEDQIYSRVKSTYTQTTQLEALMKIINAAQIISKGRCGGTYYIVDQTEAITGSYSTLMAGINAARYISGTTDIDYTDNHHATVIALPGDYSAEGRIAFSGKNIHIIGLGLAGTDTGVTIRPDTPTTFAFGGSGTGIEVANLCIAVDTAVQAIYWGQMDGNCWFHDNVIAGDGTLATYGIWTGGVKNSIIENNRISGFVTSGITVAGGADMYFYDGKIIGNQIGAKATCATAIYIAGAGTLVAQNALIAHNYIIGDNFTKTIDVDNTAADVLVADNWGYAAGEGGTERDNHYT